MISQRLFRQLDPQPELRTMTEKVKGLYGPDHTPLGECTLQVQIPELSVAAVYDFIVRRHRRSSGRWLSTSLYGGPTEL